MRPQLCVQPEVNDIYQAVEIGLNLNQLEVCLYALLILVFNLLSGMQGHLWTEAVRTAEQMYGMIFPRMMALAERAWHKASWEDISDKKDRDAKRDGDWVEFANALGYRELSRLDKMGVAYRVPPPGAR